MSTPEPLYRIIYDSGFRGYPRTWAVLLEAILEATRDARSDNMPVRVERVS